jgi:uncharacterized membrane-anchored protein
MLDHPLRESLANEVHSRPLLRIEGPARLSHLAVYSEEPNDSHYPLLNALCTSLGISALADGADHFIY